MRETPGAAREALKYTRTQVEAVLRDLEGLDRALRELRGGGYPPSTMRDGPGGSGPADPTAAAALGMRSDIAGRDLTELYRAVEAISGWAWELETIRMRWLEVTLPNRCRNSFGCPEGKPRVEGRARCRLCDLWFRETKMERTAADVGRAVPRAS